MQVVIRNEQAEYPMEEYEALLTKSFQVLKALEGLEGPIEVSILFVTEEAMQSLNRRYRGIDEPTDVLSFPQEGDADFFPNVGLPRNLGDIVISPKRAYGQAAEFGHSVKREITYLAVHGLLHLLGYEHDTREKQARMRSREEAVLRDLDLGRG
ncbi:MAG TPA: rRNA maturation RNase YbeY [Firmicutes bacterium]|nr:rRNA maturation RNase YbeY [Bacillota bacterium]